MKLLLKRIFLGENYTIGKLYIDGVYKCDTLEDKVIDTDKSGKFEGNETEVYREGFTSYDRGNYPFELTEEDKRILNPIEENTEIE